MAEQPESWAVVELMGHMTMAGRLTEEERFGSKLGRLDVPDEQGGFTTIYFGGGSVYRITAVSEAVARIKSHQHQPKPVYAWELREAKSEPTPSLGFEPSDRYEIRQDESRDDSREMDF